MTIQSITHTAAPAATANPLKGVINTLQGWCATLLRAYERREAVRRLQNLDDRLLRDIGIARADIHQAVNRNMAR